MADCFMGMPKSKDWIIYGQENDTFGLHQWLGYNLSRATGEYAARTAYLEVLPAPTVRTVYSQADNCICIPALCFDKAACMQSTSLPPMASIRI